MSRKYLIQRRRLKKARAHITELQLKKARAHITKLQLELEFLKKHHPDVFPRGSVEEATYYNAQNGLEFLKQYMKDLGY